MESGESALRYIPRFREHGIMVLDGGGSHLVARFCPWCGREFPKSLRDEWFDRLEELGIELGDPAMPRELETEEWWRVSGL